MFELEPDVAQRRAVPEKSDPTNEAGAPARPVGVRDAASLLHLQRTVGNAGVVQLLAEDRAAIADDEPSPVHDVVGKGGGTPLDEGTRASMEASFGQDFGDVRVHTDAQASTSAAAVGANAYTVGSDIVFQSGHYDAASEAGQRTIAHELSHVVQQRSGPVDGTDAPGGIRISDPGDRFERAADATAGQVVSGTAVAAAPAASGAPSVQLEPEDEDQPPVQRQVAEEDEREDETA